jgi:hypothetical protein
MKLVAIVLAFSVLAAANFAQGTPTGVPHCKYGLEPGEGAARCADPNDPNSYLYKRRQQQMEMRRQREAERQSQQSAKVDLEHPPANDPTWCRQNAKSATQLDRCWRRQHHEMMPENTPAPSEPYKLPYSLTHPNYCNEAFRTGPGCQ